MTVIWLCLNYNLSVVILYISVYSVSV